MTADQATVKSTATLVVGVGNILLSDEGAGIHAMNYLAQNGALRAQDEYSARRFIDAGTLGFTLAADIESATNLIVFDAAELGATPGHVQSFVGDDMDCYFSSGHRSVHEVGFADLLDIARLTEQLPSNRALIGIQPEYLGWGENLSEAVNRGIPDAAALAIELMRSWSLSDAPGTDALMRQAESQPAELTP